MKVLILPEDFRKDQYVVKPLIEAMFAELEIPAIVRVCHRPTFRGITDALRWDSIQGALDVYRGMIDLFLLLVDRDGNDHRKAALTALEQRVATYLGEDRFFIAEHAWQEIEVWALAAQTLPREWRWGEVRAHPHPKETYFLPFVKERGLQASPGEGRKTLGVECGRKYRRVRSRCPDDVEALEQRVAALRP